MYSFLKAIFGVALADRLTNYQHWTISDAENVDPPRVTEVVSVGERIPWNNLKDLTVRFSKKVAPDGVLYGRPMQLGINKFRQISWGYLEWGEKYYASIPLPAKNFYWTTGYPVPYFDRHCTITEPHPDKKIFHELIQLNPDVDPAFIFGNNALGWGKWEDGKLVDGKPSTATGLPSHPYVWTPWSKEKLHRLALVVEDYIGADGTLKDGEGVRAGSVVVLPKESETYKNMFNLGGECKLIAQALATHGAIIIDRQMGGHNPDPPDLVIQPAGQWRNTNIEKLSLRLGDFVYAK